MTHKKAIEVLVYMISRAVEYDRLGDVVLRQQMLRSIDDLPLSDAYVKASLKNAGL